MTVTQSFNELETHRVIREDRGGGGHAGGLPEQQEDLVSPEWAAFGLEKKTSHSKEGKASEELWMVQNSSSLKCEGERGGQRGQRSK